MSVERIFFELIGSLRRAKCTLAFGLPQYDLLEFGLRVAKVVGAFGFKLRATPETPGDACDFKSGVMPALYIDVGIAHI